jgi:hypothetical protein
MGYQIQMGDQRGFIHDGIHSEGWVVPMLRSERCVAECGLAALQQKRLDP